jgi:hypothetical protein
MKARENKMAVSLSGAFSNRSGSTQRSRYTSNSKLIKSGLFQAIGQKKKGFIEAELEQRNL